MPFDVQCQCGKAFRAPDSLAGKRVKCPGCGGAIAVPSAGVSQQSSPQAIQVQCAGCQSYFKALGNLAGKRVRCPKCQSPVAIPNGQQAVLAQPMYPAPEPDPFADALFDSAPAAAPTIPTPSIGSMNPYASPQWNTTAASPRSGGKRKPASQNKRFVNFFIDNLLVGIATTSLGFVIGAMLAVIFGPEDFETAEALGSLISMFVSLFVTLMYYVVMELALGRTIGKFVSGTKVVSENGGPPTVGQVKGRSFARFIPFEPFSFLGNSQGPVGWHDSLSGTRVVDV